MLQGLLSYILLPTEITAFERTYLQRMNRVAHIFFALHIPVFALVAYANGTGPALAFVLTALMLIGPMLAARTFSNPRHVSVTFGFTAMGLGGLLVHFGQGPMQIEMHFYFFVLIALLAVFANPVVILTAAVTVALHHLVLWLVLPQSVFNYDASIWTVVVHALFVVLESIAACFVARSFFDDVIGLERIVRDRTAEIDARNRELRLVFDTVGQGFVTLDREGRMSDERSAALTRWLGDSAPGERFVDCLGRVDANVAASFELGWEAVIADVLPLELCLEQMPQRLSASGRQLQLSYLPVYEGDALARVLVVLTDLTAELEREEAEAEQRDLLAVVDRVQRDRVGFREFLAEGEEILSVLLSGETPLPKFQRLLHTLKGNSALFGMSRIAVACHELEDHVAATGDVPASAEIKALVAQWDSIRARFANLLGDELSERVELDEREYSEILRGVSEGRSSVELVELIRGWKLEPTRRRLTRVAENVEAIARRLGKEHVQVEIRDSGARLDPAGWAPFWSAFVHVVRNSLDHGVETVEERVAQGKSPVARIVLSAAVEGDSLVVSLDDDGRGIDWAAVERRALGIGLPAQSETDLVAALLRDGFSTRDQVGALSGRGVGLGAVASACRERGGEFSIRSVPRVGTSVTFRFPHLFEMRCAA